MSDGSIPQAARVRLAHAVVQQLAAEVGADLLHVKGPAADPDWYPPHSGSDVDVIVRPAYVAAMEQRVAAGGWRQRGDYADSSAWAHASSWWHDDWGWLDLHRSWPGLEVDPTLAFDALFADHRTIQLAHRPCAVPRLEAEVLLLALHEGRSGPGRAASRTLRDSWEAADPSFTASVDALAHRLQAEVGLAAGLGRLEEYRDHPDHDLWAFYADGSTNRFEKWRARLVSARAHGRLLVEIRRALRPGVPITARGERPGVLQIQADRVHHLLRDLRRGRR